MALKVKQVRETSRQMGESLQQTFRRDLIESIEQAALLASQLATPIDATAAQEDVIRINIHKRLAMVINKACQQRVITT